MMATVDKLQLSLADNGRWMGKAKGDGRRKGTEGIILHAGMSETS